MIDRKLLFGLSLVLLSTTYDLTQLYSSNASVEGEPGKSPSSAYADRPSDDIDEQISTIPPPKIKTSAIPTIKFLFCIS